MSEGTWTCDICGEKRHIEDMGYIGPEERESTRCDPFMPWRQICKHCEEENNANRSSSTA